MTVTMPASVVAGLRAAVEAGDAASLSAFVAQTVSDRLIRDQALQEFRRFTGGPPSAEARAWAEQALGVKSREPANPAKTA